MSTSRVVSIYRNPYDVYIGRAGKGQEGLFGNPVRMDARCPRCHLVHRTAGATLPCYEDYLRERLSADAVFKEKFLALHGKTLGCFCAPAGGIEARYPWICHGQVMLKVLAEFYPSGVETSTP